MRSNWWKVLGVLLLVYGFGFGLMGEVPRRNILNESIRNVYFHVPMWFAVTVFLLTSAIFSIRYLRSNNLQDDTKAVEFTNAALVFGMLGCATGSLWARVTWGDWWPNDPKLNGVTISMLMYFAYLVLRSSFDDSQRKARISAVYNIFAFAIFVPLIYILPRLTDTLHPGNGGNPAFGQYDMDNQVRRVFYPIIIGWILLGVWIVSLRLRIREIEDQLQEN